MRQSREAKAETHQHVVTAASRMFRERGIEKTSVGDVMQAAGKTHGGFYRHFDSKEALLIAALEQAFSEMLGDVDAGLAAVPPAHALAGFVTHYLSPRRIADVAGGCPVAALAGDVLRSDDTVQAVFGGGTGRVIEAIARVLDGPEDERRQRAAQAFAMAAGAAMIARASDPQTAAFVLDSAKAAFAR